MTTDLVDEIKNAHPQEFGVLLARAGTEIERLRERNKTWKDLLRSHDRVGKENHLLRAERALYQALEEAAEIVVEEAHEETPGYCPLKDALSALRAAREGVK